ncbi:SDR family NAD(P)-dependent oxidoreductase [Brachyspira pilosicoli]|uniref:SDR family NAD(P)-dependent oxidoreductase n=1 Tax=Brachyspira pilosicoli TaxID=52584 RepID=UPI0030046570
MKKVFITGGNGSIGSGIVKIFQDNGFKVIYPSSSELNLLNNDEIDKYLKSINNNFDVFIHCAGINNISNIESITMENILNTMQINTFSFLKILKYFLPYQKINGGSILAISSLYSKISRSERASYSMSKHALDALIKTAAIELAPYNIKVNSLSPGFVDTPMTRKNNDENKIKKIENSIPFGRMGSLEDISKVAYFLCVNNSYITGQNITVDGGFICGGFQNV